MRKSNPTPRTLALATLATGLLTAGILVAAPPAGDHARDGMHRMHKMGAAFLDKIDANKDGKLSKAELAKHPMASHMSMVDANKDGSLDAAEFAAFEKM